MRGVRDTDERRCNDMFRWGKGGDSFVLAQLRKRTKPVSFVETWKLTCVGLSQGACQTPNPKSQLPPPALSDQEADGVALLRLSRKERLILKL
jgi:hypothetical protein